MRLGNPYTLICRSNRERESLIITDRPKTSNKASKLISKSFFPNPITKNDMMMTTDPRFSNFSFDTGITSDQKIVQMKTYKKTEIKYRVVGQAVGEECLIFDDYEKGIKMEIKNMNEFNWPSTLQASLLDDNFKVVCSANIGTVPS